MIQATTTLTLAASCSDHAGLRRTDFPSCPCSPFDHQPAWQRRGSRPQRDLMHPKPGMKAMIRRAEARGLAPASPVTDDVLAGGERAVHWKRVKLRFTFVAITLVKR
jgi:hypothetical protein